MSRVFDHLLDNPFWHALTGPQAAWAEGSGGARRYAQGVAPFAGVQDTSHRAWRDLRVLAAPGEGLALFGPEPVAVPGELVTVSKFEVVQMVLETLAHAPEIDFIPLGFISLGPQDAASMRDLARLTRPGPFRARTVELGGYVGVIEGGGLLAMAGERARPPGFTEISAVCVRPEARGRGLAAGLVAAVADRIQERGETPFLHVDPANTAALRLYAKLGFRPRATLHGVALRREE